MTDCILTWMVLLTIQLSLNLVSLICSGNNSMFQTRLRRPGAIVWHSPNRPLAHALWSTYKKGSKQVLRQLRPNLEDLAPWLLATDRPAEPRPNNPLTVCRSVHQYTWARKRRNAPSPRSRRSGRTCPKRLPHL